MKKKPNAHADVPRNLIFPRAELVYLPVTPEVARAVENAVQMSLDAPLNAPNPRRSAAGRAVLHARGVSLPGVEGMNRGIRCHRPVQMTNGVPLTKETMSVTAESSGDAGCAAAPCCAADHQDWYMTKCPFRDWKGRKRVSGRKSASHKRNRSRRRRYQARPSAKRWRECCGGARPRT